MKIRYPEIEVNLSDGDGNAFFIISRVRRALRRGEVSLDEIAQFTKEAKSGDYDNVLRTCMKWVSTT